MRTYQQIIENLPENIAINGIMEYEKSLYDTLCKLTKEVDLTVKYQKETGYMALRLKNGTPLGVGLSAQHIRMLEAGQTQEEVIKLFSGGGL